VLSGDDKAAKYAWKVLSETLLYSAKRIPEIADDVVQRRQRDEVGIQLEPRPLRDVGRDRVARLGGQDDGRGKAIPANVKKMLSSGVSSFYRRREGVQEFFDFASGGYLPVPVSPDIIYLPSLAERKKVVRRNAGASLYDIGDGVLCVEFHTKMNTIDADIAAMLMEGVELAEKEFAGLVIANHAEHFCAGANLMLVFLEAQNKQFGNIETMVKGFQDACMRLRYSERPVVAAPAGMALGGGTEICLGADRIRAAAETYMGLVEVGVGLLPAGGG